MVQAISPPLTFDDFVALYPEDGGRYELRQVVMTEMRPIGAHEVEISMTPSHLKD